jgi:competence protein ComEC
MAQGRGRTRTWDVARPRGVAWPGVALGGTREVLARWFATDTAAGRLMPWLPICFGLGVVLYFTAEHEPVWWVTLGVAAACGLAAALARSRPVAFPLLIGVAAVAIGFAVVTLKSARVAHPVLQHTAWNVSLAGFVEVREERERSDRIVVRVHTIEGRLKDVPERVRVSVKKRMAPPVGAYVELKARLNPPLRPLRPGGYDFSRDLYFQRIGATGFVLGSIKQAEPPVAGGAWLQYAVIVNRIRDAIDARIRAAVPGDAGAIASALITGKRDAISGPVNDAMYVSSLAHVLSISGYHMALVAGVVFFVVRALLALSPALALRHAIKKYAALAALIAAFFYLLLSGAEVATQRSFIMTAIVLIAVMVDRSALTLRNLALAALGVMLLVPEAVVHPSFQISFAATFAMIAATNA